MKKILCSVRDVVTGVFGDVVVMANDADAKRSFNNAVGNSPFVSDMQLFRVGWFDNETCKIGCEETPVLLQSGGVVDNE